MTNISAMWEEAQFVSARKKSDVAAKPLTGNLPVSLSQEAMERIAQEKELNDSLGLAGQNETLAKAAFVENVDSLMGTKEYPEVTKAGLLKLFGMDGVAERVRNHNLKETVLWFVASPLCLLAVWIGMWTLIIHTFPEGQSPSGFRVLAAILLICVGLVATIFTAIVQVSKWRSYWHNNEVASDTSFFLKLDLKIEAVHEAIDPIPYGAKLRLKEAKEANLFSRFYYVKPIVHKNEKAPAPRDPAIVGAINLPSGEEKWYLISLWDIKADQERVTRDIDNILKMKALKLKDA